MKTDAKAPRKPEVRSEAPTCRPASVQGMQRGMQGPAACFTGLLSLIFGARLVSACNDSPLIRAIGAINEAIGTADWVRIAPYGEFPNEVGLQVVDRAGAEKMVAAFNTAVEKAANLWRGLPIYEGHPDEPAWLKQNPGYKRVAVGRVKELQARDDGLYGRVAFNDQGNALVRGDAPAYEAHSPRWGMAGITHRGKSACHPEALYSLGLTNTPNIPGTQLGLNEQPDEFPPAMKSNLIALLAALGRPVADAAAVTDEQLAAAVNEATPVATAAVTASNELPGVKQKLTSAETELAAAKLKLTSAETSLQTATNEAATLRTSLAEARTARAEAVLTVAVNEGRITPAQRAEWLGKFTATNADFAAVQGELTKLKKAVNTQSHVANLGARKAEATASSEKVAAINEAVAKKEKEGLSHFDAYQAVRKAQPELFTAAAD